MGLVTSLRLAVLVTSVWVVAQSRDVMAVGRIECPGCKWICEDGQTCCQTHSGDWGCCYLPNAVCCPDGRSCCPQGHRCNGKQSKCEPDVNTTMTAVVKPQVPADVARWSRPSPIDGMVCPDHSQCPLPGAACCRQYTGRYGCCNYPLNVCCDDGVHCCHTGTVCDQLRQLCIPYPSSSPAVSLKPARLSSHYYSPLNLPRL